MLGNVHMGNWKVMELEKIGWDVGKRCIWEIKLEMW
jgi:hypothetical protein